MPVLRNNAAGCCVLFLGLHGCDLIPAAVADPQAKRSPVTVGAKQVQRGSVPPATSSVPSLLELGPDAPDATVITTVGAVTTLDFGEEKPLSFISGLREQLGVEQSAPNFPGNLIYLRPSLELAGKTTNVTVETDHGRMSFFVKTIFDPGGARPGSFHSEVRIKTAGQVSHMKMLTERITSLEKELQDTKTAEARKTEDMRKLHETEVAQQYQQGLKAVLDRLTVLPVVGKRKRQSVQKMGEIRITPVASSADGPSRIILVDVENTSTGARIFNVSSLEKYGQILMQPDVHELLPKQKVRVAMFVRAPSGAPTAVKADAPFALKTEK